MDQKRMLDIVNALQAMAEEYAVEGSDKIAASNLILAETIEACTEKIVAAINTGARISAKATYDVRI